MMISNAQLNVQSKILKTSQPSLSLKVNITWGAVLKILGITVLYITCGGTGPGSIVPNCDELFP